MIWTKSTHTPRAKAKMRTKIMVKKVDMKGVEESLPLGVRIWMRLREKRELLPKKGLQLRCHVIKIRFSAWSLPRTTANTTKK